MLNYIKLLKTDLHEVVKIYRAFSFQSKSQIHIGQTNKNVYGY